MVGQHVTEFEIVLCVRTCTWIASRLLSGLCFRSLESTYGRRSGDLGLQTPSSRYLPGDHYLLSSLGHSTLNQPVISPVCLFGALALRR